MQSWTNHQAIDHHLDVMFFLFLQLGGFFNQIDVAIDLHPLKTAFLQLRQLFLVLTLAPADDRRQQVKPGAFFHRHHPIDHLADGLALDRQAGRR